MIRGFARTAGQSMKLTTTNTIIARNADRQLIGGLTKMNRLSLGEFCEECLCAECSNRRYCGTMEGNTDQYCHSECEGLCGMMKQCSQFRPIPLVGKQENGSE